MRILIVDQCSSSKAVPESFEPFDEEAVDEWNLDELLDIDQVPTKPAHDLYTGKQQRYITQAVERLRDAGDTVDRVFISAGYGVVDEDDRLPPYDVTFAGRSEADILRRCRQLGINAALQKLVATTPPYDIVFFALGKDYYLGIDFTALVDRLDSRTMVVLFNREIDSKRFDNAVSIDARTDEAKVNGAIVVALKGKFIWNFAGHRELGASVSNLADIVTYCTTEATSQSEFEEFDG